MEFHFQEKIKYKILISKKDNKENNKVKIFDDKFVKENKSNFKLIYNGEELELQSLLEISKDKASNIVEIELKQINQITNLSNMFYECKNLYSCSGLSKLNIENVSDLSSLFRNCLNILKLPDISNWNTSNVNNMSYLFSGCNCLLSIPDISKWDTSNITNFSYMFTGCKNILDLPDISKWNTSKCIKMNNMFQGCTNLKKLPDISKWDVGIVNNMSYMFYDCKLLSCLPDISVWDTKEVVNMSSMFYQCSELNSLPNLDKWNVSNLKKYMFMFTNCKLTLNIPAFSKLSNQALNINKENPIPKSATHTITPLNRINTYEYINPESLDKSYSKKYLCCPECKAVPEMLLKNNGIAVLFCDCCNFEESVQICDILSDTSKWINHVYYKCNYKKGHEQKFVNLYCETCDLFLCEECKKSHDKTYKDKIHKLEFLHNLDSNHCEKHSSKLTKFCEKCNIDICNICSKNEHKFHKFKDMEKNKKLNFKFLNNYYSILDKGRQDKINILEQFKKSFGEDEIDIQIQILQIYKKDLNEIEDFRKLGKILYFSSMKIKQGNYKEKIINNYINIFNYICSIFDEENINVFRKSVQVKIDELKIISNNLSEKEEELINENIKNIFEPIDKNISDFEKKKLFMENNIDYSRILKKHIIIEKSEHPENYIDKDEILNDLDQVIDGINSNSSDFILSVIGKCVENNGTEVYITKKSNEEYKNLELASIQSLFSLGNQKKFVFHFNFGKEEDENILKSPEKQEDFIKVYKPLIAKEINIDENNLIFKDFHRGCVGVSCVQVESSEESDKSLLNLQGKFNIEKIEEKSLLETLQISSNILDPKGNRFSGWGINETRGGENYIPPLNNWRGFGIKVSGMYDNGNDDWLNYENKKGEFAIAYMGINNYLGETKEMISHIQEYSTDIKNLIKNKLYRNDSNIRNNGIFSFLFKYRKCGDGVCLFQNPEYAENSAGIINVCGYQIKVILMCRVNPEKIRQPENFEDCWILNPTPDEIRPYRILIKIIPNSPLTDGGCYKVSMKPVDYILELFGSKDYSFYKCRNDENYIDYTKLDEKQILSDDIFVLKVYSANEFYRNINMYLLDKTIIEEKDKNSLPMSIEQIKSIIFCIQESLKNNKNVKDGTTVYRGVDMKLADNIGIGSKFYLNGFISTSTERKKTTFFLKGKKGTLFIIKIKNNKERNYCFNIAKYSEFKEESEILISALCYYQVTGIQRNKEEEDIVNLDCLGFVLDNLIK